MTRNKELIEILEEAAFVDELAKDDLEYWKEEIKKGYEVTTYDLEECRINLKNLKEKK